VIWGWAPTALLPGLVALERTADRSREETLPHGTEPISTGKRSVLFPWSPVSDRCIEVSGHPPFGQNAPMRFFPVSPRPATRGAAGPGPTLFPQGS